MRIINLKSENIKRLKAIFVEKVDESGKVGIVIEDGEISSVN